MSLKPKAPFDVACGHTESRTQPPEQPQRQLAEAAHDLKQSMDALRLYVELLQTAPERCVSLLPQLHRATSVVSAQVDSLFDFATLGSARFAPAWQPIDLDLLMGDMHAQHLPMARRKGLQLRLRSLPLDLESDPLLLRRILGNLLANAIRYTERGGVLLAARKAKQGLAFEVWDTGPGMSPSIQARIFEAFERGPDTARSEGAGLGLTIVRELSARLGYRVAVRSRPGVGSVFRVFIAQAGRFCAPDGRPGFDC